MELLLRIKVYFIDRPYWRVSININFSLILFLPHFLSHSFSLSFVQLGRLRQCADSVSGAQCSGNSSALLRFVCFSLLSHSPSRRFNLCTPAIDRPLRHFAFGALCDHCCSCQRLQRRMLLLPKQLHLPHHRQHLWHVCQSLCFCACF